jgi:hypothetical protein
MLAVGFNPRFRSTVIHGVASRRRENITHAIPGLKRPGYLHLPLRGISSSHRSAVNGAEEFISQRTTRLFHSPPSF